MKLVFCTQTKELRIMEEKYKPSNYYQRIKTLMKCLKAYKDMFTKHFFTTLHEKSESNKGGKFHLYNLIKKNFNRENYLKLESNTLRRNITKIRISCHNLPIEYLRKFSTDRNLRFCNCCDNKLIGSEEHLITNCMCPDIVKFREELENKILEISRDFEKLNKANKFRYLMLAVDPKINFYFAIFLDKIYKLVVLNRKAPGRNL